MNIVISNENAKLINEISIADAKIANGIFDVADIFRSVSNLDITKAIIDITAIKNYNDINNLKSLISFINPLDLLLVIGNTKIEQVLLENIINIGIYNLCYNANHIAELYDHPNVKDDVLPLIQSNKARIIGLKNVTTHAGSTTLTYILKNYLKNKYNVVAIEVDKNDFSFFGDSSLISTPESKLEIYLQKYYNSDIILIDVNESKQALGVCDLVLYLVEPTMIKINKLLTVNPMIFKELKSYKVILNRCSLSKDEISTFEAESHIKAFSTISNLNERSNNEKDILNLISKLRY